jgi:RNA polymerase sigma-70 factor (TIGR02957 family)
VMDSLHLDDEAGLNGLMFSIAYRMTGSVSEAEDLVQDAFFRLERARKGGVVVESPKAYLATATTRLAIDHMQSARVRRESYVGTWLPEPIVTDPLESPEQMAELSDSLSTAFLVLLESLSPVERAVFILREVFDYPYEDIAQIVEKRETNCRQIFGRARQHLDTNRPRFDASSEHREDLVRAFLAASRGGDVDQLVDLLAADAVFYGDGGGKVNAVTQPIQGRDNVAAFVSTVFGRAESLGITYEPVLINGCTGFISYDKQRKVIGALSFDLHDGLIQTMRSVVNPDKLQHLGPVSDYLRFEPDGEDTRKEH